MGIRMIPQNPYTFPRRNGYAKRAGTELKKEVFDNNSDPLERWAGGRPKMRCWCQHFLHCVKAKRLWNSVLRDGTRCFTVCKNPVDITGEEGDAKNRPGQIFRNNDK